MVKANLVNFFVVGLMAALFILLIKTLTLTLPVNKSIKEVVMAV